jgi:tRNA(Ile)-lysidine synthase
MNKQNYVVGVSGGVDSMVLLDALVSNQLSQLTNHKLPTTNSQLIIAHFDHGIREDSAEDEVFVRGVAKQHGLPYETMRVELGKDASEEQARTARYKFLRQCCKKYNAQLITAHHQNDVTETILINLTRGTGWRGLTPMASTPQIPNDKTQTSTNNQTLRPLLGTPKAAILAYAKKYHIRWREDSTNTDTTYLRNYVRHTMLPNMTQNDPKAIEKLLAINAETNELKNGIATELQKIINKYQASATEYVLSRYDLIMFPSSVASEIIYELLTTLDPLWHPEAKQIKRTLHFVKTAAAGKSMNVTKNVKVACSLKRVCFVSN